MPKVTFRSVHKDRTEMNKEDQEEFSGGTRDQTLASARRALECTASDEYTEEVMKSLEDGEKAFIVNCTRTACGPTHSRCEWGLWEYIP